MSHFEVILEPPTNVSPKIAVFDFDGTLSHIRQGWQEIMVSMMVDELSKVDSRESNAALTTLVDRFVTELTGKPTIFQMEAFCEELARRGRANEQAEHWLNQYLEKLDLLMSRRKQALRDGTDPPDQHRLPFVKSFLDSLQARGIELYVVSGTDRVHVVAELELLQFTPFFGERVFGPTDSPTTFTKDDAIRTILDEQNAVGEQLVSFGDGVVETVAVEKAGGVPVGVAGDEIRRDGTLDLRRRERLIEAGAHAIVPDFRAFREIETWLFDR